jgi:hypothetical protein
VTQATATIHEEWGPPEYPDERSFYACSPHRIEMAAHLIRQSYLAAYANPALRLLPDWTQWCIERTGLDGDAAARSRETARSAASALVHDEDIEPTAEDDKAPFRRPELTERSSGCQQTRALIRGEWFAPCSDLGGPVYSAGGRKRADAVERIAQPVLFYL